MEEEEPKSEEEVVEALLEFLVAPLLPLKPQFTEPPSLSQQQSVAKQVHAVVLLYNYYHRKLQPQFEFLAFASFCKLVVVLKPALMAYMKFMHLSVYSEVDDLENQLSLTEKAIMDACDICISLDVLNDNPGSKEWPITKVAVLLLDSTGENCVLLHSIATHGVWSVIEKDLDVSVISSEGTREGKLASKRKRTSHKPLIVNQSTDAIVLQQLAMLTVKEVADINQTDVTVLESHVVYSLSKEKAAAHFYVMQSTRSINEDLQVPIKDAITSLQGPLVKNYSLGWVVTPVVEYFHLLPYAGILSRWSSRGFGLAGSISKVDIQILEERNSTGYQKTSCPNHVDGAYDKQVNGSLVHGSQIKCKGQCFDDVAKVHDQQANMSYPESNIGASTVGVKAKVFVNDSVKLCTTGYRNEIIGTRNKIGTVSSSIQGGSKEGDCAPLPSQSKSQYLENLLDTFNSKENALQQNALKVLLQKREELFHQMRNVEHEIALCDQTIQTLLDGGENSLVLKIDTMIEGCHDCLKEAAEERKHFEEQGSSQRLSEAVLTQKDPCQQLDDICHKNIWILPTYLVYLSDGGFRAYVTVKGVDFEVSCGSEVRPNPKEARISASLNMIANLQNIANQVQ